MGKLIFADKEIEIKAPVIRYDEPNGYSFYKGNYKERKVSFDELKKEINMFVLHHSVTYTAKETYNGLLGRRLSVVFIIDDDNKDGFATIYQCLNGSDIGYSHKPYNQAGPGVEISYRPDAWINPNLYSDDKIKKNNVQKHEIMQDKIHGMNLKCFSPTEAQVNSCISMLTGFCKLFDMEASFPKDKDGHISKTIVKNPKGLVNHYMITGEKVDPLGFPSQFVEDSINEKLKQLYQCNPE